MKNWIFGLFVFFLSACSGFSSQTSQPVKINPISVTETQVSIKTPNVTITPIAVSATPSFDFPLWMSNPETVILATLITDEINQTNKIHFINASTQEIFELDVSKDFGGFFWFDNLNFGVVVKDTKTVQKYNLQTGEILTESFPFDNLSEYWRDRFIKSKKYFTELDAEDKILTVKDTKTNETVWEVALPENRYVTEVVWSPVNENVLAFLQGSPDLPIGRITQNMTLTIVDITKGEIIATYDGDFGILEWSPDGKMLLYLDPSFYYRLYGVAFQDAPCLLILATGEKRCLRSIPRVIPEGYELLTTGIYDWTSDSNSIFYTYAYKLPSQWSILGNLCNYSLIDSQIYCPTQNLEVLKERSIINYKLSPNEQFIYFCYSTSTLVEDYAGEANDGIIKMDGTGFLSWTGRIINGYPNHLCSPNSYWRPLP